MDDGTYGNVNPGWAQIGWQRATSNGVVEWGYFYDWTRCFRIPTTCYDYNFTFDTPDPGHYHEFKVAIQSDGYAHMYIDQQQYSQTNFKPVDEWEVSGSPLEAEWMSEIDHHGNDIMGETSANQVNWTVVNVRWADQSWNWALPYFNGEAGYAASMNDNQCAFTLTTNYSTPNFQTYTANPDHTC